jgi:hypothetical protein
MPNEPLQPPNQQLANSFHGHGSLQTAQTQSADDNPSRGAATSLSRGARAPGNEFLEFLGRALTPADENGSPRPKYATVGYHKHVIPPIAPVVRLISPLQQNGKRRQSSNRSHKW